MPMYKMSRWLHSV